MNIQRGKSQQGNQRMENLGDEWALLPYGIKHKGRVCGDESWGSCVAGRGLLIVVAGRPSQYLLQISVFSMHVSKILDLTVHGGSLVINRELFYPVFPLNSSLKNNICLNFNH